MTEQERAHHRNEVIEEMCNWLESCISLVDHKSETFLSCTAMVHGMRGKKTPETPADDSTIIGKPEPLDGQHYPLTNKGIPRR